MKAAPTVLVTGASRGIGEACVHRMVGAGFRVFAAVRREDDADRLRAASDRITPVRLDVTSADHIAEAARAVAGEVGDAGLAGLVNNAGIAVAGPLEFLPIDELRRQLEVNVIGQVALTQAVLPLLRHAPGRIVFVGSIAGLSALPFVGAYAASKHALEAIADSWRVELEPWNVRVSIVEPGAIATDIWETSLAAADRNFTRMPPELDRFYGKRLAAVRARVAGAGQRGLPADQVARAVEHALTAARPKARYLVGRDAKSRTVLEALPHRLRDRLIAKQLDRMDDT
jgi:NAD(P)-dependent dehydrogenase (short-subunit alcohol dehydrogenase family)